MTARRAARSGTARPIASLYGESGFTAVALGTNRSGDAVAATPRRRQSGPRAVYRYVPPAQVVARAVTYIGDVLLEFSLTFTGSLTVSCPSGPVASELGPLQIAGAALHRIADGLFISAMRAERPTIESTSGHRFTHQQTTIAGPRTRRFSGECAIEIPGGTAAEELAVSGCLGYALDVRALAPSDPPLSGDGEWSERHDASFASIGAIVLEPVPVAADRAARLFAS